MLAGPTAWRVQVAVNTKQQGTAGRDTKAVSSRATAANYQESICIAFLALQPDLVVTTAVAAARGGEGLPLAELLSKGTEGLGNTYTHLCITHARCCLSQHPCIYPADNVAVIRKRTDQADACSSYSSTASVKYVSACPTTCQSLITMWRRPSGAGRSTLKQAAAKLLTAGKI